MKMGYGLTLEQTQKLQLTPELLQSIKILQLSSTDLEAYIEEQMLVNPVLEVKEEAQKTPERTYRPGINMGGLPYEKNDINRITLTEHLLFQLQFEKVSKRVAEASRYIISSLDDNGYLTMSFEELCESAKAEPATVRRALSVVQSFDPAGIGAADIKECLLLQLKAAGKWTELKSRIIENHLEHVALNRLSTISKALRASVDKVQEAVDDIKSLDPKPGRAFASEDETRYITPDVYVEKEENRYRILLSESRLPKLGISSFYSELLENKSEDKEVNAYLNDKVRSASWLINCIEQRNTTIYNVAAAIVKYQEEFFDFGDRYLKPLYLKQIAEEVGIHESTVSRTINGKYMETPRGMFEFKYFFSFGVANETGEGVSSNSVKYMIKELIDAENPKSPIADKDIAQALKEKGIEISRRTVAKYRDEMGIVSSVQRKRY